MADLRNLETPRFVDDTSHWSKVLHLFFSSENEMHKLQKKTRNITSKMRKQRVIPVLRARGRQDGELEHASEASEQLRGLGQKVRAHGIDQPLVHVGQERFPALLPFGFFFDIHYGKVLRETSGFGGHAVFGTRVDFGAGFFLRGRKLCGLDCLRGGPYIQTEGQSLFVLYGFFQVIISLQSKENVDKGALAQKVHYSDANRHMSHKLDKQALSFCFVSAFAQSELSKTSLEIKTGMVEWLSCW